MLENKAHFAMEDLSAIFGESSLFNIDSAIDCVGVSIDSRTLKQGNLFVALNGEKIDGHSKVGDAFSSGASAAIVSKDWYDLNKETLDGKAFIVVPDTLVALGELGNYHRLRFDLPIIAVAGSNGKTTTKDLIAHLLSEKYKVLKTWQNFNNRIGVPLMLLALNADYQAAVLEIGTNEPGEVFLLAEMVAPESGIVTNIGKEHLEKLIDLDGVEMEETSLFGYLHRKKGICFVNLDDERLAKYSSILTKKFTFASSGTADVIGELSIGDNLNPHIKFKSNSDTFDVSMQTVGLASGLNAIAAVAVASGYGLSLEEIKAGLESFKPDEYHGYARMIIEKIGQHTFLNDCYNANPSSMQISLKTLALYKGKPLKTAILGDMREMGDAAEKVHIEVLELAQSLCDEVLVIGEEMEKAAKSLNSGKINIYSEYGDIWAYIADKYEDNAFLLKGSRGMKMEKLLEIAKNNLHL